MLSANINKAVRKNVYKRDGYRCALCDDPRRLQIHHIFARGSGGPRENEMNLITLCPRCHALCHGNDIDGLGLDEAYMEQAVVEYMSDLYACEGIIWNPWSSERHEWKF